MLIEEIFKFATSKYTVKLLISVVAFQRNIVLALGVVVLAGDIFVEVINEVSIIVYNTILNKENIFYKSSHDFIHFK